MTYFEAIKELLKIWPVIVNILVGIIDFIRAILVLLISLGILTIRIVMILILPISAFIIYLAINGPAKREIERAKSKRINNRKSHGDFQDRSL